MNHIPRVPALFATYATQQKFIIDACPHCGRRHTFHAGKPGQPADDWLGIRRAPCGEPVDLIRWHEMGIAELEWLHGYDFGAD